MKKLIIGLSLLITSVSFAEQIKMTLKGDEANRKYESLLNKGAKEEVMEDGETFLLRRGNVGCIRLKDRPSDTECIVTSKN
jgi:hypothetical protein